MKKDNKKLYYSYFPNKQSKVDEKEEYQTIIIKRSEKRHKTEVEKIPKNFQFLINKDKIKKEKENEKINTHKYDFNTINVSDFSDKFKKKKNNSTVILPSVSKFDLNNNIENNNKIFVAIQNSFKNTSDSTKMKKMKSQIINKSNLLDYRRNPTFPKYERRISDKFITIKKKSKESTKKELPQNIISTNENKGKTITITKTRRRSIGAGARHYTKKESKIKNEFNKITYVKLSKAISEAGLDDGNKKTNQDVYIHEKNINGILNFNIFGVLDGHGEFGHLASNFVKRYILNRITNHPIIRTMDNTNEIYKLLKKNEYQMITNIFLDADVQITKEQFNCEMSGTTCVIVIQLDEHLICANTGDSRAILVYDNSQSQNLKDTKVFPLSYDAKPENPGEKERIIESGGEVEKMVDENDVGVGPFRVWVKGKPYPGIAMSRSIGDMDAKTVGVIPNPQFIEYKINPNTKYMIICSDGIWEYLSNEEVMKISNSFYLRNDALGLCNNLINKSMEFWLKEDNYVDDITVVVVFF